MIVFGLEGGQAKHLGHTLGHLDDNIRLVGLHVGGGGGVRTRRSRLILFVLLGNLEANKDQHTKSNGASGTSLEILASQNHTFYFSKPRVR